MEMLARMITRHFSSSLSQKPLIGLVGLGNMGNGIAKNIMKGGFQLRVHDSDSNKVRKMVEAGSLVLDEMSSCDIILLSLSDEAAGRTVIRRLLSELRGQYDTRRQKLTTVVDLGTVSPCYARKMAKDLDGVQVGFLDAPVSGGPQGAAAGSLCVMVGGSKQHYELCLPVFRAIGQSLFFMGATGAGAAAKLINQYLVIQNTVAACEGYVLAQSMGVVDTQRLKDLLNLSWGQSKMLEKNLTDLLRAEKEGEEALKDSPAPLRNLKKDLDIIVLAAQEAGLQLPLLPAAGAVVDQAASKGLGGGDFAQIARLLK